ncbi:hypothetical protein ACWGN5_17555 [Streptomyces sp. NPDC055815]
MCRHLNEALTHLANPLLAEPVQLVDGSITPRGPGLGMTWDERAVSRFSV